MTAALEGGLWPAARPGRTLPPGKTRYSLYRRLVGPQGRSGQAENLVPTGIRSRTVQSVAQSLYRLSYLAHNRNKYQEYFLGVKVAGAYGWQTYHLHVLIVLNSGSLYLLEPSGPLQACNGITFPYLIVQQYSCKGVLNVVPDDDWK